jgi:hypothetical protein
MGSLFSALCSMMMAFTLPTWETPHHPCTIHMWPIGHSRTSPTTRHTWITVCISIIRAITSQRCPITSWALWLTSTRGIRTQSTGEYCLTRHGFLTGSTHEAAAGYARNPHRQRLATGPPLNKPQAPSQVIHRVLCLLPILLGTYMGAYQITLVQLTIEFDLAAMLLIGSPMYGMISASCDHL